MNCIDCNKKLSKEKYTRCKKCSGINKKGKNLIERLCKQCGKLFLIWPCYLKRGGRTGYFCSRKCSSTFLYKENKGLKLKNKEITSNQYGKNNYQWKGENAGYKAKHIWIQTKNGTPSFCEVCGTEKAKVYNWAKISMEYTRNREDYLRMCKSCHNKFDWKEQNRVRERGRFISKL